jgi:phage terminase large subunit-like protein
MYSSVVLASNINETRLNDLLNFPPDELNERSVPESMSRALVEEMRIK